MWGGFNLRIDLFTGLIREFGTVVSLENDILRIKAKYKPNIGDSIAINGICLTAISVQEGEFAVELSQESKRRIASENLCNKVHLEPAMRLSDRLDGHIVQGHIDGIGELRQIKKDKNALDFIIGANSEILALMMPKGSVAIDGVSLTVNEILKDSFRLTIIPHTYKHTLFLDYQLGRRVNIETDLFARYIFNMLHKKTTPTWEDIDRISNLY